MRFTAAIVLYDDPEKDIEQEREWIEKYLRQKLMENYIVTFSSVKVEIS
jgi:hypothetical protein